MTTDNSLRRRPFRSSRCKESVKSAEDPNQNEKKSGRGGMIKKRGTATAEKDVDLPVYEKQKSRLKTLRKVYTFNIMTHLSNDNRVIVSDLLKSHQEQGKRK